MPDFSLEHEIDGAVCGLDEVGRGPLAGAVVAACVYIPPDVRTLPWVSEINDSKKLSWGKLEKLYELITAHCIFGIAENGPRVIEDLNILQASLDAMRQAYEIGAAKMPSSQGFTQALIDGTQLPQIPCAMRAVKKGDSISTSIAAASILAKVTRDRQMHELSREWPEYGWDSNVGYPSQQHRDAINAYGITEHHRRNFSPVRNYIEHGYTPPLKPSK